MRFAIAAAAMCAALNGYPAFAEDAANQEAVRIEMDQEAKAFVFMIDDEPVAMLDKNGLMVVEHLSFGRNLVDAGPDWIKDKIITRGKEVADE
jgi:hypothetical protein